MSSLSQFPACPPASETNRVWSKKDTPALASKILAKAGPVVTVVSLRAVLSGLMSLKCTFFSLPDSTVLLSETLTCFAYRDRGRLMALCALEVGPRNRKAVPGKRVWRLSLAG